MSKNSSFFYFCCYFIFKFLLSLFLWQFSLQLSPCSLQHYEGTYSLNIIVALASLIDLLLFCAVYSLHITSSAFTVLTSTYILLNPTLISRLPLQRASALCVHLLPGYQALSGYSLGPFFSVSYIEIIVSPFTLLFTCTPQQMTPSSD